MDASIVNEPATGHYFSVGTAWDQIGRALLLELGAKNLAYSSDKGYVQFDARRKRVVVKLNPLDEYDVEFARVPKFDYKVIEVLRGVPVENLREVIWSHFTR